MKLRTKYLAFVIILHLITLVLTYYVFKDNKLLFIVSEVFIIMSLLLSWQLYKQLLQPLQTLMSGVEAIRDRDFNVKFVKTGKFEMDQLIDVYNSMIDELREERTRQEQQHFFLEKLIQTSPTGIVILDHDNNIQQVNPKASELLQLNANNFRNVFIDNISSPLLSEINTLQPGDAKTITINGINTYKLQKSFFIDRGFERSFIMIEELTAEILAAEKKAYGKVIRMMAHEVNNTIGPVNSIINSALRFDTLWTDNKSIPLKEALEVANVRNQNLNMFMRNFADVVRLPQPNKKKINLHDLIINVTTLMKLKAGEKDVEFQYNLFTEPVFIQADEQQIEQALINIVKNAIEAIEGKGTVEFISSIKPKRLIIADSGKGIDSEVSEQLFSPFFSTKKDGQGIGLTLIKEILHNHQFAFSLQNINTGRTEFSILFE